MSNLVQEPLITQALPTTSSAASTVGGSLLITPEQKSKCLAEIKSRLTSYSHTQLKLIKELVGKVQYELNILGGDNCQARNKNVPL